MSQQQSSFQVINSIADRVNAKLEQLEAIQKIIDSHPEWKQQEPMLAKLLAQQ